MQRKGGKIALNLDEGDDLIFVALTHGKSDVMIATRGGLAARFDEERVSVMGRTARGVRGISLREGDAVAGACIVERTEGWAQENSLITITEGGFGKRMSPDEFEAKGRGIQGNIAQKITDKTGLLCGIAVVKEDEDLLMITEGGTMIRTPADGIPTYGRAASGVIVMKLADDSKLANFTVLAKAEEEETPVPDEDESDNDTALDRIAQIAGEEDDEGADSEEYTGEED